MWCDQANVSGLRNVTFLKFWLLLALVRLVYFWSKSTILMKSRGNSVLHCIVVRYTNNGETSKVHFCNVLLLK